MELDIVAGLVGMESWCGKAWSVHQQLIKFTTVSSTTSAGLVRLSNHYSTELIHVHLLYSCLNYVQMVQVRIDFFFFHLYDQHYCMYKKT